jgi:hypothetical protein
MPSFQWDQFTLQDPDFTTNVDLRMPLALLKLLMRLGETFFQDDGQGGFVPSPDADEICHVIEDRGNLPPTQVDANAAELKSAVKTAYDYHQQIVQPDARAAVVP